MVLTEMMLLSLRRRRRRMRQLLISKSATPFLGIGSPRGLMLGSPRRFILVDAVLESIMITNTTIGYCNVSQILKTVSQNLRTVSQIR
jgi:hypothetical protein